MPWTDLREKKQSKSHRELNLIIRVGFADKINTYFIYTIVHLHSLSEPFCLDN